MFTIPRNISAGFITALCTLLVVGAGLLWVESYRRGVQEALDHLHVTIEDLRHLEGDLGEDPGLDPRTDDEAGAQAVGPGPAERRAAAEREAQLQRSLERSSRTLGLIIVFGLAVAMFTTAATGLSVYRYGRERERQHQEAEASVRLLRAIITSLRNRVELLDASGDVAAVHVGGADSPSLAELVGEGDAADTVRTAFIPRDDGAHSRARREAMVWDGIQSVLAGKSSEFQLEYPVHHKDGESWNLMRVRRLEEAGPGDGRVVITHEDITARVLAAKALLESESRFRTMVASLDDLVFALDDALGWVGFYGRLAERAGLAGEAAGQRASAGTDGWQRHEAMARRALNGEHSVYEWTLPLDGDTRHIETAMSPIRDDDGVIVGAVGVGRDVTVRATRERETREREAILGTVAFASTRFLHSIDWQDSIPRVLAHLGEAIAADRVYVAEYRQVEGSGLMIRRRHEWTSPGVPPRTTGPSHQDRSWRADAFAEWRAALSRGETVGGAVRDQPAAIRDVLSEHDTASLLLVPIFVGEERVGLLGIEDCEVARDWSEQEADALRAAADTIGAAIDRGRIEEALIHREEQLRQLSEPDIVDLNAVIRDTAPMLQRIAGEEIMVLSRLDEGLGLTRTDPDHIVQILIHLVVNARDAMPGGGTIIVETEDAQLPADGTSRVAGDLEPGRYVRLAVIDDGRGIAAELHDQIFEPYYTTKETGRIEGLGTGLSTVYDLIDRAGGRIWVQSEEGTGAAFQVLLPQTGPELASDSTRRSP